MLYELPSPPLLLRITKRVWLNCADDYPCTLYRAVRDHMCVQHCTWDMLRQSRNPLLFQVHPQADVYILRKTTRILFYNGRCNMYSCTKDWLDWPLVRLRGVYLQRKNALGSWRSSTKAWVATLLDQLYIKDVCRKTFSRQARTSSDFKVLPSDSNISLKNLRSWALSWKE